MTSAAPTPKTAVGVPRPPARVVVVGSGFAGLHTARRLDRLLPAAVADITLVRPTDHLL